MAVIPKDRRGQILLLLTVGAVVVGYFGWSGLSVAGGSGFKAGGVHRDGGDFFNLYYGVAGFPLFHGRFG